jgi:hypothetical protein
MLEWFNSSSRSVTSHDAKRQIIGCNWPRTCSNRDERWSARPGENLTPVNMPSLCDLGRDRYDDNEKSAMAMSISSWAEPRSGTSESLDESQAPSGCVLQI